MKKIILVGAITVLTSCSYMGPTWKAIKFWQVDHPDNIVEEWVEDKIEEASGVDIDLTPITGEETQFDIKK